MRCEGHSQRMKPQQSGPERGRGTRVGLMVCILHDLLLMLTCVLSQTLYRSS